MSANDYVGLRCRELGYDVNVIRGASRTREHVGVRRLIAAGLREAGASYPEIGRALGGRDHSTIMSLLREFNDRRMLSLAGAGL